MASQNRTLGTFDLVGIAPAPRGVPQIEVTFDIDANGIVHVSAKDMATGKEQSIVIQSSSGLNEGDIDKMVKDAEAHAAEDAREKERIETHNQADSACYASEKALKEYGDKISAEDKSKIEAALSDLKAAVANQNSTPDELKQKMEALNQATYKVTEQMYKEAQQKQGPQAGPQQQGPQGPGQGPDNNGQNGAAGSGNDDYEVVN